MTIREIVTQGLYCARTCRSLWLFGFIVVAASGGSSGGGGDGGGGGGGGAALAAGSILGVPMTTLVAIVVISVIALAIAGILLRFISEGALIEGIARVRRGGTQTVREGFCAGWAHWGVLLRIWLVYFGVTLGSLALAAAPIVIAVRAVGWLGGIAVGVPALLVAIPWLVTIYLVQAFASRIAVLENRHALDSIHKARLFLHHRLMHGLKLIVSSFIGSIVIVVLGFAAIAPVALMLVLLARVMGVMPVIIVGCLLLLPALTVLAAMVGTLRSSIWTIGYLTEQQS